MYSQKDQQWADFPIGDSDLHMGTEGCLCTIQAEALYMAGYTSITPATLCTNAFLFTDKHYGESSPGAGDGQAGLWLWYRMGEIYSQYHVYLNDQGRFKFVQVTATWSGRRYQHWVLLVDGQYKDPIDGSISSALKTNYVPTGRVYSADIDPAPVDLPPRIFTVNITAGVNIRTPDNRTNPPIGSLKTGTVARCIEYRLGERVDDQPWWLRLEHDVQGFPAYIWAGATDFDEHTVIYIS